MMGLSHGERIPMIRTAVLIQYTRVTDTRTDGIGVAYTRYRMYAIARKNDVRFCKGCAVCSEIGTFCNRCPTGLLTPPNV